MILNSRERVRATLNHMKPDRLPIDFGSTNVTTIHIQAYKNLLNKLNIRDENIKMMDYAQQLVIPCEELLKIFNVDTRCVKLNSSKNNNVKFLNDNEFIDDWGLIWKRPSGSLYFDAMNAPLSYASSVEEVMNYPWPDISHIASAEGIQKETEKLFTNTQYSLVGSFGSSVFMRAQLLRGYEQLFVDMILQPEIVDAIMDKILEIRIGLASMLLDNAGKYLDVVELADDIASQDGPLFSLELYQRFVKPRTKALIDFIKSKSDVKVMYHCCGSVSTFINDFIEIGVDALNPVQVSAKKMDTKLLKEQFADKIVFWGGIDAQNVLPNGTVTDVRNETKKRILELGKNGGYLPFASHNIQADVNPENIIALFDTIKLSGIIGSEN